MRIIPARDTGPVDDDNYPIFCPQTRTDRAPTETTPESTHDLDYLDKLGNNDPILTRNDSTCSILSQQDDDPLLPSGLLMPGTISKSENDALIYYGLVDAIRPYHAEHILTVPEGMMWISGNTVATKQEADHPSIDRDDPHYNVHVPGQFRRGELVEYTLNECGVAAQQIEKNSHQLGRLVQGGRGTITRSFGRQMDGANAVHSTQSIKYEVTSNDHNDETAATRLVESKWYDIRRIYKVHPSPFRKLFHIKVTPESVLMAWKLKDILIDIGIAHDWLTVNIIAEYLPLCYQRDTYFNVKLFEKVVQQQSESKEEDIREIATAFKSRSRRVVLQCQWPDDHYYYHHKISDISLGLSPLTHPLLGQDPYLPLITPSGRAHIGMVSNRLNVALKPSTNLYGYQLHTVLWCHELERSIMAKQCLSVGSNALRFCPDATVNCHGESESFSNTTNDEK